MNFEIDLFDKLAGLPVHDADSRRQQKTLELAHAILENSRRLASLKAAYSRFLEPAWVAGFSALSLLWAAERTIFLLS